MIILPSLAEIIDGENTVYSGTLKPYIKAVLDAPNINHPYHGLQHMLQVTQACYAAILYYGDRLGDDFNRRLVRRNLLVASLFHDYDHYGRTGIPDAINIARAKQGLAKQPLLGDDHIHLSKIEDLLGTTEYPHIPTENLSLEKAILRDADMVSAFCEGWVQLVLTGLGREMRKTVPEMIDAQIDFLSTLTFYSEFGREILKPLISGRVDELKTMRDILNED